MKKVFKEDVNRNLEKNRAKNLGIMRRIALAILKFVQIYYKIENIFKLLDVNSLKELKTHKL